MHLRAALLIAAALALFAQPGSAATKFVFANSSNYDTLDPHAVFDVGRVAVRLNLYDGLMRWEDNPPKLQHWLAESHTVSPDGLTYTFKLRPGAKFHDGAEISADDVVYSTERVLALKKGAALLFLPLVAPGSTKALDKATVEFNLKAPSPVFLAIVAEIHVVNAALVKKNEKDGDWGAAWLASHEAGSGSYQLRRYDPAIGFIATRFAGHFIPWGDKYIDEIEFRTVTEINNKVLGLEKGDFHGTDSYLPQDQILRLKKSEKVKVLEAPSLRLFYFIIQNQRSPMNDLHFRRALVMSFDYDGFINDVLHGSVTRNPGPIPAPMWGAPKDLEGYRFDLERAKAELALSKEPLRPLTIGALAGYDQSEAAATLLQNGLRKIGVETKIEVTPFPVIDARSRDPAQTYDLIPIWKSIYYADPNNWIGELYDSAQWGSRNVSYYKNPKVDELLHQAYTSLDPELRRKNYEEASRIVVDDAAGLFIYNTTWFGSFAKSIDGVRFCPIGDGQEVRWMYFR
jgi:peptide/nickel transport system substrate-binding protein